MPPLHHLPGRTEGKTLAVISVAGAKLGLAHREDTQLPFLQIILSSSARVTSHMGQMLYSHRPKPTVAPINLCYKSKGSQQGTAVVHPSAKCSA